MPTTRSRWRPPRISSRSRHSRRRLPTQRSACARARGARTGALITLIPSERKTSSKSRVNLLSRSPIRNRGSTPSSASCISRFCALLGHPPAVRVRRDPGEMHATGRELDDEQHVEALQEQRVDGEEVALEDARRLLAQELCPARLKPHWR